MSFVLEQLLVIPVVAIISAAFLPQAKADKEGHGGGGYVCNNLDGTFVVRLVDLEEADLKEYLGYSLIPRTNEVIEAQVASAIKRLALADLSFARKVEGELNFIQDHYTDVPKRWTIKPPTDVKADLELSDCPLDGVATYWDEPRVVWIKMKYYSNMFSETDRAALFVHEAVYKVFRGSPWKDKDSIRTRKIVGILFSAEIDFKKDIKLLKNLLN